MKQTQTKLRCCLCGSFFECNCTEKDYLQSMRSGYLSPIEKQNKAKKRLEKLHGSDIIKDLEKLATTPYYTLQDVADKYNLSRERIRQYFPKVFGMSYTVFLKQKRKTVKSDVSVCIHDPRYKVAEYNAGLKTNVGFAAQVEFEVWKKAEFFGWEVLPSCNGHFDLQINGYYVDVKATKSIHNPNTAQYAKYYHFVASSRQIRMCHFFICYAQPQSAFYVIPNSAFPLTISKSKPVSFFIPTRKSDYYNARNRYLKYKEAWYLLDK